MIEDAYVILEPCVGWIKRAAAEARKRMQQLNIEDLAILQRKRTFQWAQKIAGGPFRSWQMDV